MNILQIKKYLYSSRETKLQFFARKYADFLTGSILDVGADALYLKNFLPNGVHYTGVGIGPHPDLVQVDFEKEEIPFSDNSFDCVVCLDVLEHLDNIHAVFDRLCGLTRKWVIISLPNPYENLLQYYNDAENNKKYYGGKNLKFYGLDLEPPEDRHKYFFSVYEAKAFVEYRAKKNSMKIVDIHIDHQDTLNEAKRLVEKESGALIPAYFDFSEMYLGTSWYILEK